ncbi:hypothetical protein FIV31_00245 [Coxiella endosymbiont of Ornithodoros amblus]|uniref:hypothetical protein n=1 Tax=Coxiella endosymbiont of Ornithodoros amblus TaxID=1656166 RepID=UPI00244E2971|nr:hypothetical protein [Coxiella endosymbiont of Ornithodoros amblus]MBW5802271.1 hypothetical protein [Coxiella endosymbiont of Ornithodoros amblus]
MNICVKNQRNGFGVFQTYFVVIMSLTVGSDGIFRGHAQRHYDFLTGVKMGKNDHVVNSKKSNKSAWTTKG